MQGIAVSQGRWGSSVTSLIRHRLLQYADSGPTPSSPCTDPLVAVCGAAARLQLRRRRVMQDIAVSQEHKTKLTGHFGERKIDQ